MCVCDLKGGVISQVGVTVYWFPSFWQTLSCRKLRLERKSWKKREEMVQLRVCALVMLCTLEPAAPLAPWYVCVLHFFVCTLLNFFAK